MLTQGCTVGDQAVSTPTEGRKKGLLRGRGKAAAKTGRMFGLPRLVIIGLEDKISILLREAESLARLAMGLKPLTRALMLWEGGFSS